MSDQHWAIALYERYVQLYGEPIEQPISAGKDLDDSAQHASPMNDGQPVDGRGATAGSSPPSR